MNVMEMRRADFYKLPFRDDKLTFVMCSSIIILPAKRDIWGELKYMFKSFIARLFSLKQPEIYEIGHMHDSGFRCMDVVAVNDDGEPICRVAGCSDVIHLDGIGGFGLNWLEQYSTVPRMVPPSGWSIDCLPKSGLLQLWPSSGIVLIGPAFSSLEVFNIKSENVRSEDGEGA